MARSGLTRNAWRLPTSEPADALYRLPPSQSLRIEATSSE